MADAIVPKSKDLERAFRFDLRPDAVSEFAIKGAVGGVAIFDDEGKLECFEFGGGGGEPNRRYVGQRIYAGGTHAREIAGQMAVVEDTLDQFELDHLTQPVLQTPA